MFYYLKRALKVVKVKRILNLKDDYVELQLPKMILKVYGQNMYISYIEGAEIVIDGKIEKIFVEAFL